jgi:hypothetical protein
MSEVFDAFQRDPDAIERLRVLVVSLKADEAASVGPLRAVLERRERAPGESWFEADVQAVIKGAWCAGRRQGSNQTSDAIFGNLTEDEGMPPQLRVLTGGLAEAGGDPEQQN